jgi:hypothetical protein
MIVVESEGGVPPAAGPQSHPYRNEAVDLSALKRSVSKIRRGEERPGRSFLDQQENTHKK